MTKTSDKNPSFLTDELIKQLQLLKLNYLAENLETLYKQASEKGLDQLEFLREILDAEAENKNFLLQKRRIKAAKFGIVKTIEEFKFNHPKKINEEKLRYHCRLGFLEDKANIILIGTVGLGKTHLAKAVAYKACLAGKTVQFTSAVEIINKLTTAQKNKTLDRALKAYSRVELLVIDELGYMPLDKYGCDLLFQVISRRYETASTIITSNRPYSKWQEIFNNDTIVTSAILDRILHHSDTIVIEGSSYRMRDNSK